MTGVLILHVLTERKPDVLKRQKHLLSRKKKRLLYVHISVLVCINTYLSLLGLMRRTDRATANRAKRYVYGIKANRCKEAVQKSNVLITECMRPRSPETNTDSYTLTLGFRNSIKITVFVLYLYMVWSYLST